MTTNRSLVPPGPWSAKGNTVVDGYGQTIAVVFYKHYPVEIARFIAEVVSQDDLHNAQARIDELEAEVKHLERENDRLTDENSRLEDRISDLENAE